MKTALEIAMERFKEEQESELVALTPEQKSRLREVDRIIDSKVAEKKIICEQRIAEALRAGDNDRATKLREELPQELSRLEAQREKEKQKIRSEQGQQPK